MKYVVSKELHKNGGTHFHAFLEIDAPIARRGMKIFDIEIEGRNYHPNILECLYPEFC